VKHNISVSIRKKCSPFLQCIPIESNYDITFVNSSEYDVRLLDINFFAIRKTETILMSITDLPSNFLILRIRGNNLFLKTELLCIRSLQKLSSTDLIYSNVFFSLLRERRQKLSPNCNRPITSLEIGMLPVLTNQFFLGSNNSIHLSLKLEFQLNHVRISSWRAQKRIIWCD